MCMLYRSTKIIGLFNGITLKEKIYIIALLDKIYKNEKTIN